MLALMLVPPGALAIACIVVGVGFGVVMYLGHWVRTP